MAGATMTTVDSILKEIYGPRIESQLQNELIATKRIERTSQGVVDTVGGKYVDFPIRVTRNNGIGYRNENDLLPAAGNQGFAAVHVPLKYGYGRMRVTGQTLELADKNVQAFASVMDDEMEGIKDDLAKDGNRIIYGNGLGQLATVTADGANTVTVDSIQYLEVGQFIDIALTASPYTVLASNRSITAINETTLVVTYDGADAAAGATYSLYRTNSENKEPSGFGNIISDTGALHNVDPATQPKWKSYVNANGGVNRALSEGIMILACDEIRKRGGKVSVIFCGLGVRRAYFNLLVQQRRYTDTKEFAGGFTGLAFNYGTDIPVIEDVDCKPNRMLFVTEKDFSIFRNKEWHWADDDGTVLKWVHDYDAFEGVMRQYSELGCRRRNGQGMVSDLIEG